MPGAVLKQSERRSVLSSVKPDVHSEEKTLAEAVREACLKAALDAYEDASMRGICHEGAWECAVGALRSVDVDAVLARRRTKR